MNIEIKKSEALILRRAIRDVAWLIYNDEELWCSKVYKRSRKLSYDYKVSLLKNLARIEAKVNKEFREMGYLKKKTGNTRCAWLWSITSKRCINKWGKMEEEYQKENK